MSEPSEFASEDLSAKAKPNATSPLYSTTKPQVRGLLLPGLLVFAPKTVQFVCKSLIFSPDSAPGQAAAKCNAPPSLCCIFARRHPGHQADPKQFRPYDSRHGSLMTESYSWEAPTSAQSWPRFATPTLAYRCRTWVFTVFCDKNNREQMSW